MFNKKLKQQLKRYSKIQDLEKEIEKLEKEIERLDEIKKDYENLNHYLIIVNVDKTFEIKADSYSIDDGVANFYKRIQCGYSIHEGPIYCNKLIATFKYFDIIRLNNSIKK